MRVRRAYYIAQWGKWVDMIISGWTWPYNVGTIPTSHVEIGFYVNDKWVYFSSRSRNKNGTTGTRWIDEKDLFINPERWIIYETEYADIIANEMIERANDILGLPYDWLGILGFITITGQVLNDRRKWYCSEACNYVEFWDWVKRISPRRYFRDMPKYYKLVINRGKNV